LKKALLISMAIVLAAGTAFGALGDVLGSFPSPSTSSTRGLGVSGSYLYVLQYSGDVVFRVHPTTGSVYTSWTLPAGSYRGLAFSWGSRVWAGRYSTNTVFQLNASNGSVISSWSAGSSDAYGLAPLATGDWGAGATQIFSTDSSPSSIFVHNMSNGSIINSIALSPSTYYDCAYDWRNNLVWIGDTDEVIRGYNPSGSVVASFSIAATSPYGLAYGNEVLWVGCLGPSPDYIYRISCPGTVTVVPTSLGKVKALFR